MRQVQNMNFLVPQQDQEQVMTLVKARASDLPAIWPLSEHVL